MSLPRITKRRINSFYLVLLLLVILSAEVQADLYTYSFRCISNNDAVNAAIGISQFSVDVSDYGDPENNQVLFTFSNNDAPEPEASVITKVYFDDDAGLLEFAEILDNPGNGVYFGQGVKPSNLPAGMELDPPFVATTDLSVESKKGGENKHTSQIENGIDPGESLKLVYDIEVGHDFADVIIALNLGLTYPALPGSLRIGIKGQAFDYNDGSESFVHTPTPGALILGSMGIGMVMTRLRRKTLKEA